MTEMYSEFCQTSKMEYFTKKMTIFTKHAISNAWHGSEYTSGLVKLFCCGSQRDTQDCLIHVKLIIVFTPNFQFSPIQRVIHGSTTFKLKKRSTKVKRKMTAIQFDVFDLSFIFIIALSQTSIINRSGACNFLRASN